jgi:hypothetical protein
MQFVTQFFLNTQTIPYVFPSPLILPINNNTAKLYHPFLGKEQSMLFSGGFERKKGHPLRLIRNSRDQIQSEIDPSFGNTWPSCANSKPSLKHSPAFSKPQYKNGFSFLFFLRPSIYNRLSLKLPRICLRCPVLVEFTKHCTPSRCCSRNGL